jgi:heptosyltransferase-2
VTFLAPPSSLARELLVAEPAVAETLYFAHGGNEFARGLNLLRLARLLRSRKFQRIYILDRTTRPAVAARLAGIPERIGIGLGPQCAWITNPGIDRQYFHEHPIGWLKQLMASEGLTLGPTEPGLVVPATVLADIEGRYGILPRPWLVVALGASHPTKDWHDAHWRTFLSKVGSFAPTIFVIGGHTWISRADQLVAESRVAGVNACGLSIMQSAALLKLADIFAGPDSGPMNLAASVGTEAYGLFGANPSLDYSQHLRVVRANDDPQARMPIEQITPDRLLNALLPSLMKR